MTVKHFLEGAMLTVKARSAAHFCKITGVAHATVSRMQNGWADGMRIETLDQIQRATGIPIEKLFEWYRLPDGAVLGPIKKGE